MLRSTRLFAATGVITLAVGLATAPSAFAADGLTFSNPRALPSPGFAATGTHTDACDRTTVPGWIGATSSGPTLTVNVDVPAGVTATPTIAVVDETTVPHRRAFTGAAPVQADGTASVRVPGLKDGHTYSWRAHAGTHGARSASLTCRFRVDLTAPTLSVDSTDFPPSGSGVTPPKYAGQTGTFTIAGTDPAPAGGAASGVACYQYALAPATLGTGFRCGDPGTVPAAANGSASVRVKPGQWGANTLTVEAMDNAGNVSQPVSYLFYAPSNPNPPTAPGDVDNDGVPDILLPDSAGNLQVISGGAGTTVPSETFPAAGAPYGAGSWAGFEISHRGWLPNGAPADTVFARDTATPAGRANVYMYVNQGSPQLASPTLLSRPTTCLDVTGATITCPTGFSTDWSGADQIVAPGSVDASHPTNPTLLSVEHGDLWLFENVNFRGFRNARQLTTSGAWTGYDLIAPGPDAHGDLALWARDRATGQLHVHPLPRKADGTLDFSSLADPTAGVVATGFTVAAYPTLGSSGDLDGDGAADLWAVTADRHLVTFSGYTAPKDLGALR